MVIFPDEKQIHAQKNDDQPADPVTFRGDANGMPEADPVRCRRYPSLPCRVFLAGSFVIDRFGDFSSADNQWM
jgi:hypothetical protein